MYFLYLLAGIIPSLIWLFVYLRKDSHPESNSMIARVFLLGMLVSLPVIAVQFGFFALTKKLPLPNELILILNVFFGIALSEEFFKYLVVKWGVLFHPELDEPIDLVLYMIISALGFAASENIFLLFRDHPLLEVPEVLSTAALRFVGATFLHALCSAVVGFFLALSLLEINRRHRFLFLGLIISTTLHGLYDFSIITMGDYLRLVIPVLVLISLAIFVSLTFNKLKRLKSVCRAK